MKILSNKAFEEEVQRRCWERQQEHDMFERFERIERRCAELEMQMYDLRMKADPEFRRRNTPVCDCEAHAPVNKEVVVCD